MKTGDLVTTSAEKPTLRARVACAHWLAACLKLGWSKASLDALEEIWWKHHDRTGQLR